jgi:hypothetical protein
MLTTPTSVPEELRGSTLLPRSKQNVPRVYTFRNRSQPTRILGSWHRSSSALHLYQDYLKHVATPRSGSWRAVIFAHRNQIHDANRFAPGLPAECDQLPTGPRNNFPDPYFGHRDRPTCCPCYLPLSCIPVDGHQLYDLISLQCGLGQLMDCSSKVGQSKVALQKRCQVGSRA